MPGGVCGKTGVAGLSGARTGDGRTRSAAGLGCLRPAGLDRAGSRVRGWNGRRRSIPGRAQAVELRGAERRACLGVRLRKYRQLSRPVARFLSYPSDRRGRHPDGRGQLEGHRRHLRPGPCTRLPRAAPAPRRPPAPAPVVDAQRLSSAPIGRSRYRLRRPDRQPIAAPASESSPPRGAGAGGPAFAVATAMSTRLLASIRAVPRTSAAVRPLAFQALTSWVHSSRERAGPRVRLFAIAGR
jgi:hypothetical protein